jgi:uncharacterized protein (TIGR02285 family)
MLRGYGGASGVAELSLRKHNWRRSLAVLVALVGGFCPAPAFTQPAPYAETITWVSLDFPPFQIVEGPQLGSGAFDALRNLLIREMQDVRHDIVSLTFTQREEALRDGAMLCSPGMFRTPVRERYLVYSRPALIHLDNRLVFLDRNAARFPRGAAIDLEKVLNDRRLVGGIISGRSFAPNIDAQIRRHGDAPNVRMRAVKPSQVIELLLSGQIDYTIMFPHEAAFLERQLGSIGQLANRPIAGTPPYIVTHVACTRSEWGERVIARVNGILREQRNRPEYRQFSERWYSAADQSLIRHYYARLFDAESDSSR